MKFVGKVGFWEEEVEVKPGVFRSDIIERSYTGDVYRNRRGFQAGENQQNKNLTINNQISILSDLYARNNWGSIRYVIWNEVKWEVTSVEVAYPRLVLEIGGVYNGENTETVP